MNLLGSRAQAIHIKIQNQHNIIKNYNINFNSWIPRTQDKKMDLSIKFINQKSALKKLMNQLA